LVAALLLQVFRGRNISHPENPACLSINRTLGIGRILRNFVRHGQRYTGDSEGIAKIQASPEPPPDLAENRKIQVVIVKYYNKL
jgi:hypothetical protein